MFAQELIRCLNAAFSSDVLLTHECDPYKRQMNREFTDVTNGDHHLSEEAIDVFIRIVINQANREHNAAKMFAHLTTQTIPQYQINGPSAIMGKRRSTGGTSRDGVVVDRPIQVRK
jgi:hypothetical protein